MRTTFSTECLIIAVLEVSPYWGFSSLFILQALEDNGGEGELWGFDLRDTPFPMSLDPAIKRMSNLRLF